MLMYNANHLQVIGYLSTLQPAVLVSQLFRLQKPSAQPLSRLLVRNTSRTLLVDLAPITLSTTESLTGMSKSRN